MNELCEARSRFNDDSLTRDRAGGLTNISYEKELAKTRNSAQDLLHPGIVFFNADNQKLKRHGQRKKLSATNFDRKTKAPTPRTTYS